MDHTTETKKYLSFFNCCDVTFKSVLNNEILQLVQLFWFYIDCQRLNMRPNNFNQFSYFRYHKDKIFMKNDNISNKSLIKLQCTELIPLNWKIDSPLLTTGEIMCHSSSYMEMDIQQTNDPKVNRCVGV